MKGVAGRDRDLVTSVVALSAVHSQPAKNGGDLLVLSKLVSKRWSEPAFLRGITRSLLCCHRH